VDDAQQNQLSEGIRLYNKGDYFAAQEPLEAVLNAVSGGEQSLARALLMLAAGMHMHFNRGGGRGTLNLFRQSLMLLDDLKPECAGVATAELYEGLEAYLQDLQDRKKPGAGFFDRWLAPRIRAV
jgi:predicted metal-dependent hydrolase